MIKIANYNNQFVKISLTRSERIDVLTLKNIFRDAQRMCKRDNLQVNVELDKKVILPSSSKEYFKKFQSLNPSTNISFRWYNNRENEVMANENQQLISEDVLSHIFS